MGKHAAAVVYQVLLFSGGAHMKGSLYTVCTLVAVHIHISPTINARNIELRSGYILKIKIHFSCEIEYFVETHLCKLCVILESRVSRVFCPHEGYRSATPLATRV